MGSASAIFGLDSVVPGSCLFFQCRFGCFGRGPGPAKLTKLRSRSRFLGRSLGEEDLNRIDDGFFQLSFFSLRVCLFSMTSFSSSFDSSASSGPSGSSGASGAVLPGSEVVELEVTASPTLLSPSDPSVS